MLAALNIFSEQKHQHHIQTLFRKISGKCSMSTDRSGYVWRSFAYSQARPQSKFCESYESYTE